MDTDLRIQRVPITHPDAMLLVEAVQEEYVVPAAQRRGHARRMLAHLEASAAAAGVEALVLETGIQQPEAIALYVSSGYEPVPGFGHYRDSELSRTFGRLLNYRSVLPTKP